MGFAITVVNRFMNNPNEEHLGTVNRILRYLKMTLHMDLYFGKDTKRDVEVLTDADWVGSVTHRRSTSECCTFLWENLDLAKKEATNCI